MFDFGWRGVGSSFKVYTYGAALQAGLVTPASLLNDQSGVIGGVTFNDWDAKHEGYISLRTALAQLAQRTKRMRLGDAWPIAQSIVEALSESGLAKNVTPAAG